jgi:hypothetical protein
MSDIASVDIIGDEVKMQALKEYLRKDLTKQ